MREIDEISGDVLDTALRIHRDLGPGLLETVYETVLAAKLNAIGYRAVRQQPVNIDFEGLHFEAAFRIDILVDDRLLVKVKSIERLSPIHSKQLLTDVLTIDQAARWAAYKLWWRNAEGRRSPRGERLSFLRVSASPRESIKGM